MKRLAMVIVALAALNGLCFAEGGVYSTTSAAKPPAMKPLSSAVPEVKIFRGTVDSVTSADATKGTKAEISLVDEAGKKWTFIVNPTTTIYDATLQAISLSKINKDDKATVKYQVNSSGANEAQSIGLMK